MLLKVRLSKALYYAVTPAGPFAPSTKRFNYHELLLPLCPGSTVCSVPFCQICVFCLHVADTEDNPVCGGLETTIIRLPLYSAHWDCRLLALTDFLATETKSVRKQNILFRPSKAHHYSSESCPIMCGGVIVSRCSTAPFRPLLTHSDVYVDVFS